MNQCPADISSASYCDLSAQMNPMNRSRSVNQLPAQMSPMNRSGSRNQSCNLSAQMNPMSRSRSCDLSGQMNPLSRTQNLSGMSPGGSFGSPPGGSFGSPPSGSGCGPRMSFQNNPGGGFDDLDISDIEEMDSLEQIKVDMGYGDDVWEHRVREDYDSAFEVCNEPYGDDYSFQPNPRLISTPEKRDGKFPKNFNYPLCTFQRSIADLQRSDYCGNDFEPHYYKE